MRRRVSIAGVAVVTLAGAHTGSAQAQSLFAHAHKFLPTAHFQGTNGYDVTVSGGRDEIVLIAERAKARVSFLSSDERVGQRRLVGSFGSAGSIAMEFDGQDRPRDHRVSGCEGRYTTRRGVWRGSFRFLGNRGFTSVVATEAPGRVVTRFNLDCNSDEEDENDKPPRSRRGYSLEVFTGDRATRDSDVGLDVSWLNGRRRADVSAIARATDGPVSVSYEVIKSAPRDRVHLSIRRGRARVAPGQPFVGAAKYRAGDKDVDISQGIPVPTRETWEGNLAVVLPGLGLTPLTGPGFKPRFGSLTVTTLERRSPLGPVRAPMTDVSVP